MGGGGFGCGARLFRGGRRRARSVREGDLLEFGGVTLRPNEEGGVGHFEGVNEIVQDIFRDVDVGETRAEDNEVAMREACLAALVMRDLVDCARDGVGGGGYHFGGRSAVGRESVDDDGAAYGIIRAHFIDTD